MAEDKEKELLDTPLEGDETTEKENPSSLFSRIGKIFLIILVLGLQGWFAYYLVGKNYKTIYKFTHSHKKQPGIFYEIKDVVVNPANTKGEHYLLVSLGIELKNKDDLDFIKKQNPIIRDHIILTLSKESMGDLNSIQGRQKLKFDLLNTINSISKKKMVRNLFFTEYVMQ